MDLDTIGPPRFGRRITAGRACSVSARRYLDNYGSLDLKRRGAVDGCRWSPGLLRGRAMDSTDSPLLASIRDRWPYAPRFADVNGWRMHYVDEGEGDPIVLLHGNPTWGFLYRDVIGPLVASGRRVIVPDMI